MFGALAIDSLLIGVQHALEPDHVAAVSALASQEDRVGARVRRAAWQGSQWALGHGITILALGGLALAFKSTLPGSLSAFVEAWVIGPMMIALGLASLRRVWTPANPVPIQAQRKPSAPIPHLGADVRSFGVGVLHGAAGTGGALAIAIGLGVDHVATAMAILGLESIGVLVVMAGLSTALGFATQLLTRRRRWIQGLHLGVGVLSIWVGVVWLARNLS